MTVEETTSPKSTAPFVLGPSSVNDREVDALLETATISLAPVAVLEVAGPGAVQCIQGLLTSDVESAGNGGVTYGAVLTTKGRIICDMWVTRTDGKLWITVPSEGLPAVQAVFTKYLPPRLAQVKDKTDQLAILRLAGPNASILARKAGLAVPDPGQSTSAIIGGVNCLVSRPGEAAYFNIQVQIDHDDAPGLAARLYDAGATHGTAAGLELARILSGWPRYGAEIDEKTLPQEVRFDEHNGVSYTKGCYTGQETVARLHFRGHVNRSLCGLIWSEVPDTSVDTVSQDGVTVGRVTSLAWIESLRQQIGLAIIHRKADLDRELVASNATADAVELPFDLEA